MIGYTLSSEEHGPARLVSLARGAEEAGFGFAVISDHFHPWTDRQGQSPFVWSVLGGIAHATSSLTVGVGVACPIIRMHPAIIAQAAATTAAMMPGRFFLGVGTGENLNEHILGDPWPSPRARIEMLEEAVGVIRLLWQGGFQSHRGRYYTVDNARLYTLPDSPSPLLVAAAGTQAARLAGRVGDGLISVRPDRDLIEVFRASGGGLAYGQLTVCWAEDEQEARLIAHQWWPIAALNGNEFQELATPADFEVATQDIDKDAVAASIVTGPDPERHIAAIEQFPSAGFDHVYLHQVGPHQEGFLKFCQRLVLPAFS
jgi:coenzyme F420-dependent glucose-6-phosphate dehydrogenase